MFPALVLSVTIAAASAPKTTAEKLAAAIAASQGKQNVRVYVGTLPPDVRIAAPLPKFALLGSVVDTRATIGAAQETSVYYELPAESAMSAYRSELGRNRWKPATFLERAQQAASARGGFVLNPPQPVHADLFCSPNGEAAAIEENAAARSVSVSLFGGRQSAAMCSAMMMMNAMASPPPPPPLPDLRAPAGVTIQQPPSAGMLDMFNETTSARITGAGSLATIGGAFGQQLTAAGWSADPAAQTPALYAQAFHFTNKGHHYRTVLLITAAAPQTYDASLDMQDLDAKGDGNFGVSFPN